MKLNSKYMHAAVVHAAIELGSMKELANVVAKNLGDIEVYNVHADGFTLRQKKSMDIDDNRLTVAIADAVCDVLDKDIEETTDYIMDNYEFAYNPDNVTNSGVQELLTYNYSGRLIYVEIDM